MSPPPKKEEIRKLKEKTVFGFVAIEKCLMQSGSRKEKNTKIYSQTFHHLCQCLHSQTPEVQLQELMEMECQGR